MTGDYEGVAVIPEGLTLGTMIDELTLAQSEQVANDVALGELSGATEARNAAIDRAGGKHSQAVSDASGKVAATEETVASRSSSIEHAAETAGLTDGDLVYVFSLRDRTSDPATFFNFERASRNLERYRRMVPGTLVLVYSASGDTEDVDGKLSSVGIIDGGRLASEPSVSMTPGDWGVGSAQMELKYTNGRTEKQYLGDGQQIAIGDNEVGRVTDAWVREAAYFRDLPELSNVPGLIDTTAVIVGTGVENSSSSELSEYLVDEYVSALKGSGSMSSSLLAYVLSSLPSVNALNPDKYEEAIAVVARDPDFDDSFWPMLESIQYDIYRQKEDGGSVIDELVRTEAIRRTFARRLKGRQELTSLMLFGPNPNPQEEE